jgi:hypothetical protein
VGEQNEDEIPYRDDSARGGLQLRPAELDPGEVGARKRHQNDGRVQMTMFGQTLQGTYKVNPESELEWTMNGTSTKAKFNVTATELELTDDQNRTIKYKRK